MPRYHAIGGDRVPFTPEEEAEWDAREAAERLPNALALFRAKRDQVVNRGIMHAGNRWHTDPPSQHAMSTTLKLGEVYERLTGQPFSTIWKTLTGSVQVTIAELEVAGLTVGGYVQAAFVREDELIQQAEGGNIAGALAALDTGWPESGQ